MRVDTIHFEVDVQDGDVTLEVEADVWYRKATYDEPRDGELTIRHVWIDGHEVGIETWSKYEQEIDEKGWEVYDRA